MRERRHRRGHDPVLRRQQERQRADRPDRGAARQFPPIGTIKGKVSRPEGADLDRRVDMVRAFLGCGALGNVADALRQILPGSLPGPVRGCLRRGGPGLGISGRRGLVSGAARGHGKLHAARAGIPEPDEHPAGGDRPAVPADHRRPRRAGHDQPFPAGRDPEIAGLDQPDDVRFPRRIRTGDGPAFAAVRVAAGSG